MNNQQLNCMGNGWIIFWFENVPVVCNLFTKKVIKSNVWMKNKNDLICSTNILLGDH